MIDWDNVPVGYNVNVKVEGNNGVFFYDSRNATTIEQFSFMGLCVHVDRAIAGQRICEVIEFRKGLFSERFLDKVHCGYAIFNKGKDGRLHRVARHELQTDSVLMSASEAETVECVRGREESKCIDEVHQCTQDILYKCYTEAIRVQSQQEILPKLPKIDHSIYTHTVQLLEQVEADPMIKVRSEWGCAEAKAVEAMYEACRQYKMVREKDS